MVWIFDRNYKKGGFIFEMSLPFKMSFFMGGPSQLILAFKHALVVSLGHGNDHVWLFGVGAILHHLVGALLQGVLMIVTLLIHLCQFLFHPSHLILVLLISLFASCDNLICNLSVGFNSSICIFLRLILLREQSFPPAHIIHRFVLVREQVPLDERRVLHGNLLALPRATPFQIYVRKLDVSVRFGTLAPLTPKLFLVKA